MARRMSIPGALKETVLRSDYNLLCVTLQREKSQIKYEKETKRTQNKTKKTQTPREVHGACKCDYA